MAVEPASSPLLTEGRAGPHGLQGIGANFVPANLDLSLIDEIIPVTEADAYAAGRLLARTEGLLCGITLRQKTGQSIVYLLQIFVKALLECVGHNDYSSSSCILSMVCESISTFC